MPTFEDHRGDIIDALWDTIEYLNHGPIDADSLEARLRKLLDDIIE